MTDAYLHPILRDNDDIATLIACAVAQGATLEVAVALANTAAISGAVWWAHREVPQYVLPLNKED